MRSDLAAAVDRTASPDPTATLDQAAALEQASGIRTVNKVFIYEQLVRFAHCDPAGIVYYPWFLDMAHSAKEDWFGGGLGYSHFDLIRGRRIGTPTVNLQCDFVRTVEMGQLMRWELRVAKVGNASVQLSLTGTHDGEPCVKVLQTIAFMNLDTRKAIPIPADLRPRIEEYLIA